MSDLEARGNSSTEHEPPSSHPQIAGGDPLADLFRALADPALLRLLEFVVDQDPSVAECSAHLGVSFGCVARQLDYLADCGCVEVRVVAGKRSYGAPNKQVIELLNLARSMAFDRRSVLAACIRVNEAPRHGYRSEGDHSLSQMATALTVAPPGSIDAARRQT